MTNPDDDSEVLALLDALLDGTITPEQHARLESILTADPQALGQYFRYIDLHVGLQTLHGAPRDVGMAAGVKTRAATPVETGPAPRRVWLGYAAAAAALLAVSAGLVTYLLRPEAKATIPAVAVLSEQASARFYGLHEPPTIGAPLSPNQTYALTDGLVHVTFTSGAEAIIQAPAVFEIRDAMRMVLNTGRCSVHAQGPAVGFVVDTPMTRVTDRGTRFSVDVDESGDAVVQVAEGKAQVLTRAHGPGDSAAAQELLRGMARRYACDPRLGPTDVAFESSRFIRRLPDRTLRYTLTRPSPGAAQELVDVAVQRGGRTLTYRYEDLIGVRLTHFKGADSRVHMITPASGWSSSDPPSRFLSDRYVTTGIINPAGAPEALDRAPVMSGPQDPAHPNTPGFAVRFDEPVINDEGPDVVYFELQVVVHPLEGDPFHVSPLMWAPGLRSHTVRKYDIDLASPQAVLLGTFRLYKFDRPIDSVGDLDRVGHNDGPEYTVPSKLLAVGIDLSDLGYAPGAKVDGLFFQDAMDDVNYIDPVLIAGLPPTSDARGDHHAQ